MYTSLFLIVLYMSIEGYFEAVSSSYRWTRNVQQVEIAAETGMASYLVSDSGLNTVALSSDGKWTEIKAEEKWCLLWQISFAWVNINYPSDIHKPFSSCLVAIGFSNSVCAHCSLPHPPPQAVPDRLVVLHWDFPCQLHLWCGFHVTRSRNRGCLEWQLRHTVLIIFKCFCPLKAVWCLVHLCVCGHACLNNLVLSHNEQVCFGPIGSLCLFKFVFECANKLGCGKLLNLTPLASSLLPTVSVRSLSSHSASTCPAALCIVSCWGILQ